MSEPIDWRRFEISCRLWQDYQEARREHESRKTWWTWIQLKLAKSNYESFKKSK